MLLTVKEVAKQTRVCERIVRGWITSGELAHIPLGARGRRGKIMVDSDDLAAFINSRKVKRKEPAPKTAPARKQVFKHLRVS
jgi:excisionase family DNA binding protein